MEQFKRAQVILLPGKKSKLCLTNNKLVKVEKGTYELSHIKTQHLYIISNDEIKKGDWFIFNNRIVRAILVKEDYITIEGERGFSPNRNECKKIIATTNTSLKEHDYTAPYPKMRLSLPQPSQQFIEKYIEEYNKGNIITDIIVEYNEYCKNGLCDGKEECFYKCECPGEKLKINLKDNTITIKKIKDSWNREEVETLLIKLESDIKKNMDSDDDGNTYNNISIYQWIKENL